jgi:hypothetical protein
MQVRCDEVDLLRGETMKQTDTIADLKQQMRVMEVRSRGEIACYKNNA